MTAGELREAAPSVSDNTAANLLLASFGGPPALAAYLRSLGDDPTRLDRGEPELNEASRDPRDTTTPAAMTELLRKLALGSTLSAEPRAHITAWLVACKTGDKRLRAGVLDRLAGRRQTGSGGRNATNDIAVVWPPGRAPVVVTSLFHRSRRAERRTRSGAGGSRPGRRGGSSLLSLPYCGVPRFASAVSSVLAK